MKVFLSTLVVALAAGAFAEIKCPSAQSSDRSIELLLPHSDCDKFFKCTYGEPVVQHCPAGLWYNAATWQCDYPENVACRGQEPLREKESSEKVIVAPNFIKFRPNGCPISSDVHWLLPSWFRCSEYYACVFGKKVKRSCPKGLHFNRKLQVCDYPNQAACLSLLPFHG